MKACAIPVLAALATLAACTSERDLQDSPGAVHSFTVKRPVAKVYLDIKNYAKRCFESGFVPGLKADIRVDGDLVGTHGQINSYMASPRIYFFHIDVDQDRTDTKVVVRRRNNTTDETRLESAANGGSPECP